jgi:hypothetical protein
MTIYDDLLAAGLPVIDAEPGQTPHFSRLLTLAEEDVRDSIMNKPYYRLSHAKETAKNIPNWATWSQSDWNTYFNNNLSDTEVDLVTSLATARVMLKRQNLVTQNLVKLIIAMRDQMWPDLPE